MTQIPFETYKNALIEDIRSSSDYSSLEARLLDAQLELDSTTEYDTDNDLLVKILTLSHRNVMEGRYFSHEEAECFLDQRLYEFRNKMVGTCVAEPC